MKHQISEHSKAFTRLVNKHKGNQFYIIGLMEPFQDKKEVEGYRKKLGMEHAVVNANGKIWIFIDEILKVVVVRDDDQKLTLKLQNQHQGLKILIFLVHAKYTQGEITVVGNTV